MHCGDRQLQQYPNTHPGEKAILNLDYLNVINRSLAHAEEIFLFDI